MKIIIPMTGKSSRFKQVGIETPKQFLKIQDEFILKHIINMFPGEEDVNFIVSNQDSEDAEFQDYMKNFEKYKTHLIDFQTSGPGGALLESKILKTNDSVLINYCDFANIWDWNQFKALISESDPDGIVPAYRGLHPHNIYNNDYAFIKNNGTTIKNIREKESFTKDKINEYASSGTYYFKSGFLAEAYLNRAFEQKKFVNKELYISTPYQEMVNDSLNIKLFHIDHFFQWGTPEDYNEFKYNLAEVENANSNNKINLDKINLLIPAAGKGERFKNEGYETPKINLKVNGKTIIQNIIECFNNQAETKVLLHENDNLEFNSFIDKDSIVEISERTGGQAESSLRLLKEIDNSLPILFHSADCILDKDLKIKMGMYDVIIYTKKNYRRAFSQSLNYGWVNKKNQKIESFSIKEQPKSEDSSVILGVFLFKNKEVFERLYFETLDQSKNKKEIHIDNLVESAMTNKMKIKIEESENSIMLGTPLEYELFNYMNKAELYLSSK